MELNDWLQSGLLLLIVFLIYKLDEDLMKVKVIYGKAINQLADVVSKKE